MAPQEINKEKSAWEKTAPWFITIICTIALSVIGWYLISSVEWFKRTIFDCALDKKSDIPYRTHMFHLYLAMIKRSIGLFAGFTTMLIGLGISFYTLKDKTKAELQGSAAKAIFATTSSGIIALIIGWLTLVISMTSKDVATEDIVTPTKDSVFQKANPHIHFKDS